MPITFQATTKVWEYQGQASWHFLTLDYNLSEEIKTLNAVKRGWGSVRVKATIGKTTWQTSLFPSKPRNGYILPLKKLVRTAEKIQTNDLVTVKLQLIDSIIV